MLRALLAIVATVTGLVLLLGYRTPRMPRDQGTAQAAVASPEQLGTQPCDPDSRRRKSMLGPQHGWDYGHLQVRATLIGCRIVDVKAVGLKTTNSISQRRSTGSLPMLRSEVLSRQCTDVDAVSGATLTSEAYMRSLQAAVDGTRAQLAC